MNKPNQTIWRFPSVREEVVPPAEPPNEKNVSSLVPVPEVYPPDHEDDEWCACNVCDDEDDTDDDEDIDDDFDL